MLVHTANPPEPGTASGFQITQQFGATVARARRAGRDPLTPPQAARRRGWQAAVMRWSDVWTPAQRSAWDAIATGEPSGIRASIRVDIARQLTEAPPEGDALSAGTSAEAASLVQLNWQNLLSWSVTYQLPSTGPDLRVEILTTDGFRDRGRAESAEAILRPTAQVWLPASGIQFTAIGTPPAPWPPGRWVGVELVIIDQQQRWTRTPRVTTQPVVIV